VIELIPLVLGIIIPVFIILYIYLKRVNVSKSFIFLLFISFSWSLFYFLEITNMSEAGTVFWRAFRYTCVALMPVSVLTFTFNYLGKHVSKLLFAFLLVIPVVTMSTLLTNNLHHLFFTSEVFTVFTSYSSLVDAANGIFFWVHAIYAYVLMTVSLVALIVKFFEVNRLYKKNVLIVFIGLLVPFVGNILYVVSPLSTLFMYDLTTTMFVITHLLFLIGFINYSFLDLLPVARNYIFNDVINPIFILDKKNQVVDFNKPAKNLIVKGVIPYSGKILGSLASDVFGKGPVMADKSVNFSFKNVEYYSNILPIIVDGVNHGKLIVISDVTDVKRIESLRADIKNESELKELRRGFLARMSHELRQPLVPIIGYTDQLLGEVKSDKHKFLLRKVIRESMILRDLINKTVVINSLQLGSGLNLVSASIVSVVNNTIREYETNYGFKGLKLVKDYLVDANLMIDVDKFKNLVINLIDNAVKNTVRGSVRIVLEGSSKSIVLRVIDTGKGISSKVLNELKKAYYVTRLDPSVMHTGLGTGLLLVKLVSEAHNGSFEINSKLGSGTEVIVKIPIAK